MKTSPRIFPLKILVALTVAIVLAHLALLGAASVTLSGDQQPLQAQPAQSFSTRSIKPALAPQIPTERSESRAGVSRPPAKTAQPEPTDRPPVSAVNASAAPPDSLDRADHPNPELPPSPTPTALATPESAEVDALALAPRLPREPAISVTTYAIPAPVRLSYQIRASKFPFGLNSDLLWQQDGKNFNARLEFSAFGQARVQTSQGQITAQGLAPLRFSDKYRNEVAAHFDRERGKVRFSANTPDMPLLSGAQDRLSILVQLAALVGGDPGRFPPTTTIEIQTIGPRGADLWLFTVGSLEMLSLPGGEQAALKLVRNPRREFDQKVELWLAPALGYLPARVRITEHDGDYVDQQWRASAPP